MCTIITLTHFYKLQHTLQADSAYRMLDNMYTTTTKEEEEEKEELRRERSVSIRCCSNFASCCLWGLACCCLWGLACYCPPHPRPWRARTQQTTTHVYRAVKRHDFAGEQLFFRSVLQHQRFLQVRGLSPDSRLLTEQLRSLFVASHSSMRGEGTPPTSCPAAIHLHERRACPRLQILCTVRSVTALEGEVCHLWNCLSCLINVSFNNDTGYELHSFQLEYQ